MKALVKATLSEVLQRTEAVARVPVDACYHYRGARYGGFGNHPYEDYLCGLARGDERHALRQRIADLLLNSRPRTMDQALSLELGDWPIWQYPWVPAPRRPVSELTDPHANTDPMCHWCAGGVLASQVNREFGWLEGAFDNLQRLGYQPETYGFVRCLELRSTDRSAYIVLDGNHRLGAWFALGHSVMDVKLARSPKVRREDVERWPRVRDGSIGPDRALRIFDRYFERVNPPLRTMNPGCLIIDEPPAWTPC